MQSARIRYRPVRIGWCVRDDNFEDVGRAIRWTHCLWGGRFNPIIPVNDVQLATALVQLYRIDLLFAVADETAVKAFIEKFPWLRWPNLHNGLFTQDFDGTGVCNFVDIYHTVRKIAEENENRKRPSASPMKLFAWQESDPLRDVFAIQFGEYPGSNEIHVDYASLVLKALSGTRVDLRESDPVPADACEAITPSVLSADHFNFSSGPNWDYPGVYVGDASNFTDIVNFWNLRAATLEMIFFDPKYEARLTGLKEHFLNRLSDVISERSTRTTVGVWSKDGKAIDLKVKAPVTCATVGPGLWNGLNLKPPSIYSDEVSVLGTSSEFKGTPSLSIELRQKPFYDELGTKTSFQLFVASVRPLVYGERSATTFNYPFLPELNEFYRREVGLAYDLRSEPLGLGVIVNVMTDQITIRAISMRQLLTKIFEVCGIKAEPSEAGRIASRVIQQVGGVQGCRVFKIPGVRNLIEEYKPSQWFKRSEAIRLIGQNDAVTGLPNFEAYENLYIESRDRGKLKPRQVFDFLLRHNVFRVGYCFVCPNCELKFWTHLDDIETEINCEYCGQRFNVTTQLDDGRWAYRRSGLFGRDDHQQGAIPVSLTLQQIDTVLHSGMLHSTSMNLAAAGALIDDCETDFVILSDKSYFDSAIDVAIGECKARDEITVEDVNNLSKVADALAAKRIRAFIVFSKTSTFSPEEIERCKVAQPADQPPRVILLSDRELEPYFVYERASKEVDFVGTAVSLEDLARSTQKLYLNPKPKK